MAIHRNIKLLALHNFFTDFVLFAPVAIIYFQKVTGSFALGMSVFSVAYVSSAVFELPTGIFSDIVGRKWTVIWGSFFSVICVVLYAVGGSYAMLLAGSLFQGLSRAFFSGNNEALLHDSLRETDQTHQYGEYLGKTSTTFQIALAAAAVIGSVTASRSFAWVMWLSVIPQIAALIVATQLTEPTNPHKAATSIYAHMKDSAKLFITNPILRDVNLADVTRFGLGESVYFLRSAFVNSLWPLWAVGISNMLANLGGGLSYYYSDALIKKFKEIHILNFEIIFNRIVNFAALLFPSVLSPVLISASSLSYGVGSVALGSLMQKEFTDHQRATMGSINSLAGNVVFGIYSIALGVMSDRMGVRSALLAANVVLLVPLYLYRRLARTQQTSATLTNVL